MQMTEQSIAVIGVGNEYRCDDGAGIAVARALTDLQGVRVMELPGEGTEIIEAMAGYDEVVLVDASSSNSHPGKVTVYDASEKRLPVRFFHYSTHAFGLAEAIEVARALGRLPDRVRVYAIEGHRFEAGTDLSIAVREAVSTVVGEIRSLLAPS